LYNPYITITADNYTFCTNSKALSYSIILEILPNFSKFFCLFLTSGCFDYGNATLQSA